MGRAPEEFISRLQTVTIPPAVVSTGVPPMSSLFVPTTNGWCDRGLRGTDGPFLEAEAFDKPNTIFPEA